MTEHLGQSVWSSDVPVSRYRTIVVDPPWDHPDSSPRTSNGNHWDSVVELTPWGRR